MDPLTDQPKREFLWEFLQQQVGSRGGGVSSGSTSTQAWGALRPRAPRSGGWAERRHRCFPAKVSQKPSLLRKLLSC